MTAGIHPGWEAQVAHRQEAGDDGEQKQENDKVGNLWLLE
jgi:hypothetical protein